MDRNTLALLALAIAFEVGWAVSMKLSDGFSRLMPAAATVVMYILSVVFLGLATRKMEIGAGYAIWAGSGVALNAIVGMIYFRENVSLIKVASIMLIVAGIAGLQLARKGH